MTEIPKDTTVSFYCPRLRTYITGVIVCREFNHLYKVEISEPNQPQYVYVTEGVIFIL